MTLDTNFGWTKFYMEFADQLMNYRDDRGPLVEFVRGVCRQQGLTNLENHPSLDGSKGLQDICPFTTMGTFNRGISDTKRLSIASALGTFLGVTDPVPESLDGIPTLTNTTSVVPWDISGVDALWRVFTEAIRLADFDDDPAQQSFVKAYDEAQSVRGVRINLTMGLFWIRPRKFPTLDGKSQKYMSDRLARIHRRRALGTALEEARGCPHESGIMVL